MCQSSLHLWNTERLSYHPRSIPFNFYSTLDDLLIMNDSSADDQDSVFLFHNSFTPSYNQCSMLSANKHCLFADTRNHIMSNSSLLSFPSLP